MGYVYGLKSIDQSADSNHPHIFGYKTIRTTPGHLLFDLWNGPTNAARVFSIDLAGNIACAALSATTGLLNGDLHFIGQNRRVWSTSGYNFLGLEEDNLTYGQPNQLLISSIENVFVAIDSNNNQSDRAFIIGANSADPGDGNWVEAFRVTEAGAGTFAGGISATTGLFSSQVQLVGAGLAWVSDALKPEIVKKGPTPPADADLDGFSFHRYHRSTEESVFYQWHVPGAFHVGDASVRGHYGLLVRNPPAGGEADETVVMGFEYKKLTPGTDVFDFTAGTAGDVITTTITAGQDADLLQVTAIGTCITTGWVAGDVICFRLYRDATNINDTYDNAASADDNDVWVGQYHLEHLVDKLGEAI